MAVDRLRRALNAVRDAQEMLERIVRKGPVALRRTLPASIEDLEWTADALSTALLALQETTDPPVATPVTVPELAATRPS
jgi:prophage DNA circulation protein